MSAGVGFVHAPKRVEHDRERQTAAHVAAEKGIVIIAQHGPRGVALPAQLAATLAEREVEGNGHDGEVEPVGDRDACDRRAEENAQQKAGDQQRHIEDGEIFQPKAVTEVDEQIHTHAKPTACRKAREDTEEQHCRAERGGKREGRGNAHRAAGDGTAALGRVQAVGGRVAQVIDDVDERGEQAERRKAEQPHAQRHALKKPSAEKKRQQHENIFHIVLRAQQAKVVFHALTSFQIRCSGRRA